MQYFQDALQGNHCYGCGTINPQGLGIKSYWQDAQHAVCAFSPQPHHCAAPTHFLNGGIIATIIDCHCICTAIAHAFKQQDRDIFDVAEHSKLDTVPWYATGTLNLNYLRPVAIDQPLLLIARVDEETDKQLTISCQLKSQHKTCVEASVVAVRVPSAWMAEKS